MRKLPDVTEAMINFGQLADDGLAYSKQNKRSYKTDVPRFANLKDWIGNHPAEELTAKEIEGKLAIADRRRKVGTFHVQPLSFSRVVELSSRNSQSQSEDEPGAVGDPPSRR